MAKPKSGTGVYCWHNTVNGKRYVGSAAISFQRRKTDHEYLLDRGSHVNCHLQAAWVKYGAAAFEFIILEKCSPGECVEREQAWMDFYKVTDQRYGYNLCPKAGSQLGVKFKLSKPRPPVTDETKRKISEAGKGRVHSEDTKAKMSASQKGKNLGRKHTAEHRAKIAAFWKGRKHSVETRAKMSATHMGRKFSPEHLANLAGAQRVRYVRNRRNKTSVCCAFGDMLQILQ